MRGVLRVIQARRWAMSEAERLLWERLRHRQLGVSFQRHVPVGPYVVDFLCRERQLVVELEVAGFAASEEDRQRDLWLASHGFQLQRFGEQEVLWQPEAVVAAIWRALGRGALPAAAPYLWGGALPTRRPPLGRVATACQVHAPCPLPGGVVRVAGGEGGTWGRGEA
jgi:very-short-patch-repair endonuclease